MTKRERHFRLAVRIDKVFVDAHLRIVPDKTLNHCRDLGAGEALRLRIDGDGVGLYVPIDHHTIPFIAGAPFGHWILFPALEPRAVRSATARTLAPQAWIAQC